MNFYTQIDFRGLPGTSKLLGDVLYNYPNLSEFYPANPYHFSNFKYRHEIISERQYSRQSLVDILIDQNRNFGGTDLTFNNIHKLIDSKTCAIVTGQQVGLFGGPLFTLYKAITILLLTEKITRDYGSSVVPIFWLASDDHDLKEALHFKIIGKDNTPILFQPEIDYKYSGISASEFYFDESITGLIDKIFDEFFDTDFKAQLKSSLESCYKPGTDLATAFGKWITLLLGKYGLIVLNPSEQRVKKLARDLFEKEIRDWSPSTQYVFQVSEKLEENGYHAQLILHEGVYNLFYHSNGRKAIKFEDGKIIIQDIDKEFSPDELIHQIRENPACVSPNVVLRPLFQDFILPTVAYIAGPNELSYFAQLSAIYNGWHIPMPLIFPRSSLTLLEGKVFQIMDKYGISINEVFGNPEKIVTRILKETLPEDLETEIQKTKSTLDQMIVDLKGKVQNWDPTLVKSIETSVHSMSHQMDVLAKKILASHKKKNDTIRQQIYKVTTHLYPDNNYQERELNIIPYLCKYGFSFIDNLMQSVKIELADHQVIKIG